MDNTDENKNEYGFILTFNGNFIFLPKVNDIEDNMYGYYSAGHIISEYNPKNITEKIKQFGENDSNIGENEYPFYGKYMIYNKFKKFINQVFNKPNLTRALEIKTFKKSFFGSPSITYDFNRKFANIVYEKKTNMQNKQITIYYINIDVNFDVNVNVEEELKKLQSGTVFSIDNIIKGYNNFVREYNPKNYKKYIIVEDIHTKKCKINDITCAMLCKSDFNMRLGYYSLLYNLENKVDCKFKSAETTNKYIHEMTGLEICKYIDNNENKNGFKFRYLKYKNKYLSLKNLKQ